MSDTTNPKVVSGEGDSRRFRIGLKTAGQLAAVVVLLALVVALAYWLTHRHAAAPAPAKQAYVNQYDLKPQGPLQESLAKSLKGDYPGAQAVLDTALKTEKDKGMRYKLLLQKCTNALNARDYATALSSAQQAQQLQDDYNANISMARSYEGLGERAKAAAAYQQALDISKNDPSHQNDRPVIEQKIKDLSS